MERIELSYEDSQTWEHLRERIKDRTDEESMSMLGLIFCGVFGFLLLAVSILGRFGIRGHMQYPLIVLGISIALLCLAFLSGKWFRSLGEELDGLLQKEKELLARYDIGVEPDPYVERRYTHDGVRCGVYCKKYLTT